MGNLEIHKYHFTLGHQIKDIELLEQTIQTLSQKWDIEEKALFKLNLVLEELISNTMYYGFADRSEGIIEVDLSHDGQYTYVSIRDNARAFDPTDEVADSTQLPLDDRAIGGLGIMLSQRISEDMVYEREEPWNILTLKINNQVDGTD